MKYLALATSFSISALALPAHAIDSIPLDQLKPGLWKVVRTIDRHDGNAEEVRQSEYCASPKKEITRTLRAATLLCKTNVTKTGDNKYEVAASCKLPGISGTNKTVITILNENNYSAVVDTMGTKFGEKQHRSEKILAVRDGDCKEQP
ncbi:MAG: DUF3617 family protein [Betaproteobacteria bacterium]|nr:MAG: DUF3617 family protein [Betaproteobacteria bacterium]